MAMERIGGMMLIRTYTVQIINPYSLFSYSVPKYGIPKMPVSRSATAPYRLNDLSPLFRPPSPNNLLTASGRELAGSSLIDEVMGILTVPAHSPVPRQLCEVHYNSTIAARVLALLLPCHACSPLVL